LKFFLVIPSEVEESFKLANMNFLKKTIYLALFAPMVAKADNFQDALSQAAMVSGKAGVEKNSLNFYVATLTSIALSLLGIIFFILMIYGGYIWMIARGDEKEATKAKDIIKMGIIGLIVVLLAYVISKFLIDKLIGLPPK